MSSGRRFLRATRGRKRRASTPDPAPEQVRSATSTRSSYEPSDKCLTELTQDVVKNLKRIKVSAPYDYEYLPEALQGHKSSTYHKMLVTCANAVVNSDQPRRTRSGKQYTVAKPTVRAPVAKPSDDHSRSEDGMSALGVKEAAGNQRDEASNSTTGSPTPVEDEEMPDAVFVEVSHSIDRSENDSVKNVESFKDQETEYDGDSSSEGTGEGGPTFYASVDGDSQYEGDEESVSSVARKISTRTWYKPPASRDGSSDSDDSEFRFVLHAEKKGTKNKLNTAAPTEGSQNGVHNSGADRRSPLDRDSRQPTPPWPEHCLGCDDDEDSGCEYGFSIRPTRWKPGSRPSRRNLGANQQERERSPAPEDAVHQVPAPKARRFTPCTNRSLHDPERWRLYRTPMPDQPHGPEEHVSSKESVKGYSANPKDSVHSWAEQNKSYNEELELDRANAAQRTEEHLGISREYVWSDPSVGQQEETGGELDSRVVHVPAFNPEFDARDENLEPTQNLPHPGSFSGSGSAWRISSRILDVPHHSLSQCSGDRDLQNTQLIMDPGSFQPFGGPRSHSHANGPAMPLQHDGITRVHDGGRPVESRHPSNPVNQQWALPHAQAESGGSRIIEVPTHELLPHPADIDMEETQALSTLNSGYPPVESRHPSNPVNQHQALPQAQAESGGSRIIEVPTHELLPHPADIDMEETQALFTLNSGYPPKGN